MKGNKQKVFNLTHAKRIFFYRVCGTGMGAAACLIREVGFHVEGADLSYAPPMSDYLKSTGIILHDLKDVTDDYLLSFDVIVVGNVVSKSSEDAKRLERFEKKGVILTSFPEIIGNLVLKNQNVVGIAGTHGKTTTTYLFTQVFEKLGMDPGYFIGGVLEGKSSSHKGDGSYFFIESDEYDSSYFQKVSKFLFYEIDHLILTSLEFDHADIFKNISEIQAQFQNIIPKVTKSFIVNKDYSSAKELFENIDLKKRRLDYYSEKEGMFPKILSQNPNGTEFELSFDGQTSLFKTNLTGSHNILNLVSVIIFSLREGFEVEEIKKAILNLFLVKRRQEFKGYYKETIVIDDFAHHPKAVDVTLDAIQKTYPDKEIIVFFEASSATARSSLFQLDFAKSLSKASEVFLLRPSKKTTVAFAEDFDSDLVAKKIGEFGVPAQVVSNLETLLKILNDKASLKKLFLFLSNGQSMGLWQSEFADVLKK